MRIVRVIAVLAAVSLFALSFGCGGGGGGGGAYLPPAKLATGSFIKTVETSTGNGWSAPFHSGTNYEQHLVLADDIDGSGYIQSISFRRAADQSSVVTCPSFTIMMGNTSLGALTTTFASNVQQGQGTYETVRTGSLLSIPTGSAGEYFTIQLETPFYYNGVDNLVVGLSSGAACSGNVDITADASAGSDALWSPTIGGATGSLFTYYLNMKFSFTGGDDAVGPGGSGTAPTPFATLWRTQMLYPADEIDGSGPVTGLGMQVDAPTVAGSYTYTVKMGHTTVSSLTTTFADNFDAGRPTTIVSNGTFTIPAGVPAGDYIWVPLQGTFKYNGTDNLVIDIDVSRATASNYMTYSLVGPGASVVWGDTGSATANLGGNMAELNIKLRFNGGTMDTVTSGTPWGDYYPFWSVGSPKRQYLYPATMLGTKGTINKIALRLASDSAASSYANVEVVLGHTHASELTSTFADNMADAKTVYYGTYSIPAGSKAGDWIEIPFSHPFSYDGKRNLVVQVAADQGTATNYLLGNTNAQYLNYHAPVSDRTSATADAVNNYLADQRLWISK